MRKRNWMVAVSAALILLVGIASIYAASHPIIIGRATEGNGWILVVSDDDIDASAELLTELDTTFVQLAAADTIYAVSSAAGDTSQTLYVSGVDNVTGNYTFETFTLNGTTPTAESSTTFLYVDQTWVDIECAGTISVSRYDGPVTLINSIEIGSLKGDIGHHFNGEKISYVTNWWATSTTTSSKNLELRWYPDDADCLDSDTGFMLLDRIYMGDFVYRSGIHPLGDGDSGARLPAGGWLAVFGTGGAANQEATVTVIGKDRRR